MPTNLPLELWFAIFDNLDVDRDKTTLFACARSCKTLVAPSYYRLYNAVTVASLNAAKLRSFTEMIQSPSPNPPGKYVRRLSIFSSLIPTCHLNSIISALARNLPRVICLHLYCPDWRDLSQHAKSTLKTGFQTVKRLELSIDCETGDEMLQLIASFPSLVSLGPVTFFRFKPDNYKYPLGHAPILLPSGLQALDISSNCLYIFDRLLRLNHPPNLRTLRILVSRAAHRVPEFGPLLEFLGPKLESLALYGSVDKMWSDASPDHIKNLLAGRVVSLASATNLRSITIHTGIFPSSFLFSPHAQPSACWALYLLSQITSPHLSEVDLAIFAYFSSALDRFDWNGLDEVLARPLWRDSLKQVVISLMLPRSQMLCFPNLNKIRLRLPVITTLPGVLCRIKTRPFNER